MIRIAGAALAILLAAGPQDTARIQGLVKQLDSVDWVDQAKAAKELVSAGKPALEALSKVSSNDPPAVRYWADTVSREIRRRTGESAPAAPPTGPQEVALSVPATPGFAPGENDLGSVMFI